MKIEEVEPRLKRLFPALADMTDAMIHGVHYVIVNRNLTLCEASEHTKDCRSGPTVFIYS